MRRRRWHAANLRASMNPSQSTADVAVVGLGRVGLPLALSFADRGLRVIGIDNDAERLGAVRDGRMPFGETGRAGAARPRASPTGAWRSPSASPTPPRARHIVITLGTPSFSHIEIDMRDIRSALDDAARSARARPLADPALDRRARDDRVRRRLPRQAPRL